MCRQARRAETTASSSWQIQDELIDRKERIDDNEANLLNESILLVESQKPPHARPKTTDDAGSGADAGEDENWSGSSLGRRRFDDHHGMRSRRMSMMQIGSK